MKPKTLQLLELRQDIFTSFLQTKAEQHRVGTIGHRRVRFRRIKSDLIVNKHEVVVNRRLIDKGDRVVIARRILDEIEVFETKSREMLAQGIVQAKSRVLKDAAFLRRTLSTAEYMAFVDQQVIGLDQDLVIYNAFQSGVAFFNSKVVTNGR